MLTGLRTGSLGIWARIAFGAKPPTTSEDTAFHFIIAAPVDLIGLYPILAELCGLAKSTHLEDARPKESDSRG